MSQVDDFLSSFDEQGRFKTGDGEIGVIFLSPVVARYPGKLRFKGGLLVAAEMEGASPWGFPDEAPLDGLKFRLDFPGEKSRVILVEQGRVVRSFGEQDRFLKEKFLSNLGVARNLFVHSRYVAESTDVNSGSISEGATRGALWLASKSVRGFDVANFPELMADRRAKLVDAVRGFEVVANQVPADKPPTNEQYGEAATFFSVILDILSPYLPVPEESSKVEKSLRNVPFPPWVVNWDYELGSSADGDAAVWVNVFADENVSRNDYGRFGTQIIPTIREALAAEGVHRWPYIRLRTVAEYKTA